MTTALSRLIGETQARVLELLRRSRHSITSLAAALDLTDNAVRLHIAALRHDGLVEDVGAQRDTGGKPARLYGLSRAGAELFPKAYALVLGKLVAEIVRTQGRARAVTLLRAVGEQAAGEPDRSQHGRNPKQRLEAAAAALRELGTDAAVEKTADGWRLQGYGCPLSAVTADHAEVCELGRALVEQVAGTPVIECCQRGEHPRCGFSIAANL
jgi:predicted ArsR family transcriptional regulator